MIRHATALRTMLAAIAAWLAIAATPALAQWRVMQGIDMDSGGAPSVLLIGDLDERTGFYAKCVGRMISLSIESYDGQDEALQRSGIVDIGLTLDDVNTSLWWTTGQQTRRPGYLTTHWTDAAVINRTIQDIMAAKTRMTFSIYIPVVRTMTDYVSARPDRGRREFLEFVRAGADNSAAATAATPAWPQQEPAPQQQPAPQPQPIRRTFRPPREDGPGRANVRGWSDR